MFWEIDQRFVELKPQVMVVEGLNCLRRGDRSGNRPYLLSDIAGLTRDDAIRRHGEAGFSTWIAIRAGIPVYCGEPEWEDEIAHLVALGYSQADLFLHYLIRAVDQYHRSSPRESFEEGIQRNLSWFQSVTQWQGFDYSVSNLEQIAAQTWPEPVALRTPEYAKEKVWPTKFESVVNDISRASSDYRELAIIAEIKRCLQENDRVFVTYGGSHLVRQEPVLDALFEERFRH